MARERAAAAWVHALQLPTCIGRVQFVHDVSVSAVYSVTCHRMANKMLATRQAAACSCTALKEKPPKTRPVSCACSKLSRPGLQWWAQSPTEQMKRKIGLIVLRGMVPKLYIPKRVPYRALCAQSCLTRNSKARVLAGFEGYLPQCTGGERV